MKMKYARFLLLFVNALFFGVKIYTVVNANRSEFCVVPRNLHIAVHTLPKTFAVTLSSCAWSNTVFGYQNLLQTHSTCWGSRVLMRG
jgi:hypothetical protein